MTIAVRVVGGVASFVQIREYVVLVLVVGEALQSSQCNRTAVVQSFEANLLADVVCASCALANVSSQSNIRLVSG